MNHSDKKNNPSFLQNLLIEPEYRIVRHLLLVFILAIISMNQAFMTMMQGLDILGNKIYLQSFLLFASYMLTCYFNLYILLPRCLLKKRYALYIFFLVSSVFVLVVLQTLEEWSILNHFNIPNEAYSFPVIIVNALSAFALVLLSISGGAMTILLKHWLTDSKRVGKLEKLHIQSEVEQLKEQVSPHLLFNILNRTGVLAMQKPAEASDMLIRLSQLLRYQLYDCNREQVLLSAEIKFLSNYLTLEQMYSHSFRFNIQSDDDCPYTLVAPLLFISFVQTAVIRLYKLNEKAEAEQNTALNITFATVNKDIVFSCSSEPEALFFENDFPKIRQRLELLYPSRYSLHLTPNYITLKMAL